MRIVVDATRRVRYPHLGHQLERARVCLPARQRLMRTELLRDLPADGVHGRQRRQRILEDHRDLAPAHLAHLALAEPHQVASAVEHLPLGDRVRVTDEPHDRQHRDGLSRAGFADDAEHLAEGDRKRELVDGADQPALRAKGNAQVAHLEQGHLGVVRHGEHGGRAGHRRGRWPRSRSRRRTRRTQPSP